jgi:AraC-like DNA-binding protein
MKDLTHPDLASSLLDALASFRMKAASGMEAHGPGLFSYCALTRERLASVRLPQPVLGVVLSGTKEIWQGMHQLCLKPGEVWTSEGVARAIGMSESTLRRRLRAAGGSFTAILRRERMMLARRMLEQGMPSGLVALAVGYASRSHFARAWR